MAANRRRYVRRMPKIYGNLQPNKRRVSFKGVFTFFKRLTLPLAGIAFLYLILVSSVFKVKHVEVRGASLVEPNVIESVVPLGGNIWFFSKGTVASVIEQNPGIEEVRILRGLPDSIRVEVLERDAAALWVTGTKGSVIDSQGIVIMQYDMASLPDLSTVVGATVAKLPRVHDTSGLGATPGEQVTSTAFLSFIVRATEQQQALLPESPITSFNVGATTYDVTATTQAGLAVSFNSLGDPAVQVRNWARLVRDGKVTGAQKVDLRIDRWAYVQ